MFSFATLTWIFVEAFKRLLEGGGPIFDFIALSIMVLVVFLDYSRAKILARVGREYMGTALIADSLHFSSDAYATLAVIAGLLVASADYWYVDSIIAIGISVYFLSEALEIARLSVWELTDRIPPS